MKVKFGDIVREVKLNVDRTNNPYEFYVAGDHMDGEDLTIRRKGRFATDDVGPAFTRIFRPGQILYGSRRTYLKKVAVADFDGICSNTTFILESKEPNVFCQELLPFIMLSEAFTKWSVSHSKGSTNPYVLFSDLAGFTLNLPSLDEQKVLADKLWAAYRVKESYRKLLAATDDMVKAKFVEMFDYRPLDLSGNTANFDKYCKDFTSKAEKIPAGDYQQSGKYAIFDQSQDSIIAGYTDREDGVCTNFPVVLFGDHSRSIKYIDEPYYIGADGVKIVKPTTENIIPKFLYYDLLYHEIPNTGYNRHFKYLKMIHLTEATLEEQQQFVDIATQAEATKASLRQSIESIDRVIKSLINQ